jgi:hypothetical protein
MLRWLLQAFMKTVGKNERFLSDHALYNMHYTISEISYIIHTSKRPRQLTYLTVMSGP